MVRGARLEARGDWCSCVFTMPEMTMKDFVPRRGGAKLAAPEARRRHSGTSVFRMVKAGIVCIGGCIACVECSVGLAGC